MPAALVSEAQDYRPARRFSGTLRFNEHSVETSFLAGIDAAFRLRLSLDELPYIRETQFITTAPDDDGIPHFALTGTSEDGVRFASDTTYFTRFGTKWDAVGRRHDLDATCAKATFHEPLAEPQRLPKLALFVRGFESFDALITQSPFGSVRMRGNDGSGDINLPSGILLIEGIADPDDPVAWRDQAEDLLDHVRQVMSFVAGTDLSVPVTWFGAGSSSTIDVERPLPQHRADMPVFHPLDRRGAFEAAVTSFRSPCVEHLWMTIEWLTMHATHNESRLLNAMTALENLINSNVPESQRLIVEKPAFRQLKDQLREQILAFVASSDLGDSAGDVAAELSEKLGDVQRRSLRRNLATLVDAWGIPMGGLEPELIRAAFAARNDIVHRGVYYQEGADQPDLWNHVTLVRELVTRAILTAIGFRGNYFSHHPAYHMTSFPPQNES